MKIRQRDIVEVCFELPNGQLKVHPALVISGEEILNEEDMFYTALISSSTANLEYAFELTKDTITKPMYKRSFVKCHLIQTYQPGEVLKIMGSVRIEAFKIIKDKIIEAIFS